jgi:hypothetical protein
VSGCLGKGSRMPVPSLPSRPDAVIIMCGVLAMFQIVAVVTGSSVLVIRHVLCRRMLCRRLDRFWSGLLVPSVPVACRYTSVLALTFGSRCSEVETKCQIRKNTSKSLNLVVLCI